MCIPSDVVGHGESVRTRGISAFIYFLSHVDTLEYAF